MRKATAGTRFIASRIAAPSLLTGRARGYSDGYLYSIIRYGRGVMPRYGDKVYAPSDRWAIVNHIRKLQAQFGIDDLNLDLGPVGRLLDPQGS